VRNLRHPLVLPAINLYPAFLIIGQGQPLVAPGARTDRVGMAAAGGCWIHAQLAYDVTNGAETEGTNVAGGVGWIGAGGCEEVVVAV
jgi:hypothetical protein